VSIGHTNTAPAAAFASAASCSTPTAVTGHWIVK
jgi:hypothetical protein